MQRQTLRDWVHRYNADGVAGLLDRSRPARHGPLSAAQRAEFDTIVEAGPDVAVDGVVRWRRCDLKRVVEARFGVVMAERTMGDLLRARGFRHVSVRPRRPSRWRPSFSLLSMPRRAMRGTIPRARHSWRRARGIVGLSACSLSGRRRGRPRRTVRRGGGIQRRGHHHAVVPVGAGQAEADGSTDSP